MTQNIGEDGCGGTSKQPLEESTIGTLGHTINVGDNIITFTQVYGRGTRVAKGIYLGLIRTSNQFGPP